MIRARNRRGFTLIEVSFSIAALAVVLITVASMMIGSLRCYRREEDQTRTDMNAVMAMQRIVNDVREARQVTAATNQLTVTPPLKVDRSPKQNVDDYYYDRTKLDTASQVTYYLSNTGGTIGATGTYLWRLQNGRTYIVAKSISDLECVYFPDDTDPNSKAVKITIHADPDATSKATQTRLTERVVYMRNYYAH